MSMIMELYKLSDTNINYLLKNPETIEDLMSWLQDYVPAVVTPRPSLLDRVLGRTPAAPPAPPLVALPQGMSLTEPEGTILDLDKAWHAMHYLLTGSAWGGETPYNFLLAGTSVGDIEIGYGPARVHMVADVRAFHDVMQATPNTKFQSRFNPDAMMQEDIYPSIWDREGEDQWILEEIDRLRDFTASCKDANLGCLIALV